MRICAEQNCEGGALAGFTVNGDGAAQLFHSGFDDVEADAAAGDVGDFGGGRKAGLKNLVEQCGIDSAPVIADRDRGAIVMPGDFDDYFTARFNSMINGVADQVNQRFAQGLINFVI